MKNNPLPKQKYHLGDEVVIEGHIYTVSEAAYTNRIGGNIVAVWYRLLGPLSFWKYESELDKILGIDAEERDLIDGVSQ